MREWIYKIVLGKKACNEKHINKLGKEGWELSGIASCVEGPVLYFRKEFIDAGTTIIT